MTVRQRAEGFAARFGLTLPILHAPMAGLQQTDLAMAVMAAGGMGGFGATMTAPDAIRTWAASARETGKPFQVNLWTPDPPPQRDAAREAAMADFLSRFGPAPSSDAGDIKLQDFDAQCDAMIEARPAAASSIMGVFPPQVVTRLKAAGIAWFATATTLDEALQAEAAGADAIIAQGFEAGGHRGAFDAALAERQGIGLMALLPHLADRVKLPLIAAGGIADGRGIAAALTLGASAVQIGTGFLRCPEARIPASWAERLAALSPEDTVTTRAFSGRLGRSIATGWVEATLLPGAPRAASYPTQRGLTAAMREAAGRENRLDGLQAWAGQSAALSRAMPAGAYARAIWAEALNLLP